MILNESLTVIASEISPETKQILETFQEALAIVYNIYHRKASDKRGSINTIHDFKELKQQVRRFSNYPFMAPVIEQINQIQTELIDKIQSTRSLKKQNKSPINVQPAMDIWKSGNIQGAIAAANQFIPYIKAATGAAKKPLQYKFNPFYHENPLIFGTTNFLEVFEKDEILKVIHMDLNKFKYSYLPLNDVSKNDFQYLAYFMLELSDNPKQEELKGKSLSKYFDMTYQDEDFKKLIKNVTKYLYDNDKKLIPEIMSGIKKFPKIYQANEQAKQEITTVYRGYPDDDNYADTQSRYIATSKYRSVAKRFALKIGHLESEDNRRSDMGYIDIYKVDPKSIILDTTIFGGIFGEAEVIIDAGKTELIDTETV